MRRFLLLVAALATVTGAMLGGGAWWLDRQWHAPLTPNAPRDMVVNIAPGSSLRTTSSQLTSNGIIRSARQFEWLGRWQKQASQIKPGEYQLGPGMTPSEVLSAMVAGNVLLHPVTLPEGLTVAETVTRLVAAGFGTKADYAQLLTDPARIREHNITGSGVKVPYEGYLFPDTYHFERGTPAKAVIDAMVGRLEAAFTPGRNSQMKKMGWDRHRVLTLASLIEKETALAAERPRVSAVFHNRLKRRMRLQTDPTVIYATPNYDGDIRAKDLRRDDPYNTYRRHGLPPGPIAAPGEAAIDAALFPAANRPTQELYFVSRGDGSHVFSGNINDHNRAVKRFQLRR